MSSPSDHAGPPPQATLGAEPSTDDPRPPHNWIAALLTLFTSRIDLIQLESRQAAKASARRVALVFAAVVCAVFTWALLVVASVAAIAHLAGWPWFAVAFAAAALHLTAGIIMVKAAKPADTPPFPATRAEFQKDREWIESLKKSPKSNS